ncbi:hypothetical protein M388_10230 [Mesotoga sp. Brook.08.YT.4.2.5.4.]|nr:hypothetical protein M388_10230 [Mesotoga sp. Brook.08.YT.4.2.5.4.]
MQDLVLWKIVVGGSKERNEMQGWLRQEVRLAGARK